MGKHKSSLQDSIMLRFMESNPDMAKGFIKGDKAKSDMQWRVLVDELNSNGPPTKDVVGWKKVWIDWKATVRKKIAHNNSEARATGGGPYNKYVLTSTEEKIGQICGIFKVVEGIENTRDFGQQENEEVSSNDDNERSSVLTTPTPIRNVASTPKRRREPSFNECIKKYMGEKYENMNSKS
ncbi:uncharacterized protein LOC118755437 [Rhagoletis pomonella]|uniref:uncharacterized protein LOC118755437 n=1 Tax=Rhagoletis pomonella TaxID=28610 RepID=UPI00177B7424|nr:uncharacterized protein LOC118755437 [Rhagoletis pomonella]